MNAILGMTRLVLASELAPQQREYLEKAEQAAKALLRILNDILDFSKIEAGRLEMEEIPFRLADVLQGIMDIFTETASGKGLKLTLEMSEDIPLALIGDPLRLNQIFVNLVGNALKFTTEGGVTISATTLELTNVNALIEFTVRDTGIGLTEEQLEKLFTAFTQAEASTTRQYGGTGLGLVISRRLVEMMHGQISCSSTLHEGSEFFFTARFPLTEEVPEEAHPRAMPKDAGNAEETREESWAERLTNKRILVAEDNEINQIIIREVLERVGLIVDMADNGLEAVQMASSQYYDLVFMDIQMPEMDGLAATEEIRKNPKLASLPIVAMTAHAMVGDKEKSLASGMNDHITKPIDINEVFTMLERWTLSDRATKKAAEQDLLTAEKAQTPDSNSASCTTPAPGSPQQAELTEPPGLFTAADRTGSVADGSGIEFAPITDLGIPADAPGLNFSIGLSLLNNDTALYRKRLLEVVENIPNLRSSITEVIISEDTSLMHSMVHAFKETIKQLGLTELESAAENLEMAAKANNFSSLFPHIEALESSLRRFHLAVSPLLS
jgi:CheY-like chemotaxis protein/HPt (histidine-containing phosphotransfer) domain-containing protein